MSKLSSGLNEVYGKMVAKMMDDYLEVHGYDTVRVVPRSRVKRLKQFLRLEPKRYRNVAQKGYKMSRDWLGMPIQVPKGPKASKPNDKEEEA